MTGLGLVCALASPAFSQGAPGGDREPSQSNLSIYGLDMEEASKSNFFSHFRFRASGFSVTSDGFTEIVLRLPKSNRFRAFVSVYIGLDSSGKIMRAHMHLKRRFIEDKVQGAFARDFAKSFVQAAVPEEELVNVRELVNEIFFRQNITRVTDVEVSSQTEKGEEVFPVTTIFKLGSGKLKEGDIILMGPGGKLPSLPKAPSELYKCFNGQINSARLRLSSTALMLCNQSIDGEANLVMSVMSLCDLNKLKKQEVNFDDLPMHIPGVF